MRGKNDVGLTVDHKSLKICKPDTKTPIKGTGSIGGRRG